MGLGETLLHRRYGLLLFLGFVPGVPAQATHFSMFAPSSLSADAANVLAGFYAINPELAPVTFTVHLVDYNPYETEDFARATPPAVSSSSQVSVELFEAVVDPTGTSPEWVPVNFSLPEGLSGGSFYYLATGTTDGSASSFFVASAPVRLTAASDDGSDGGGAAENVLLAQLDKTVYKPGQTILTRTIMLSPMGLPIPGLEIEVKFVGPSGYTMAKFTDVTDEYGMVEVEMPTSTDTLLGQWNMTATTGDHGAIAVLKSFTVEEYVLPKFDVQVSLAESGVASYLTLNHNDISGTVTGVYTYGQPVRGSLVLNLLQPQTSGYGGTVCARCAEAVVVDHVPQQDEPVTASTSAITLATMQMEFDGEATFDLTLSNADVFQTFRYYSGSLVLEVALTEDATMTTQKAAINVPIALFDYRIVADTLPPSSFRPGLPFRLEISALDPGGSYLDRALTVTVKEYYNDRPADEYTMTVNTDGEIKSMMITPRGTHEESSCCVSTFNTAGSIPFVNQKLEPDWELSRCCASSVHVIVSDEATETVEIYLDRAVSLSQSFLKITAPQPEFAGDSSVAAAIGKVLEFSVSHQSHVGVGSCYALLTGSAMGHGEVYAATYLVFAGSDTVNGSIAVPANVPVNSVGFLVVSCYAMPEGQARLQESVVDSVRLTYGREGDGAAPSEADSLVSALIDPNTTRPGRDVQIEVHAQEGSRVFLLGLDRSAALLSDGVDVPTAIDLSQLTKAPRNEEPFRPCWRDLASNHIGAAGLVLVSSEFVPQCFYGNPEIAFDLDMPEEARIVNEEDSTTDGPSEGMPPDSGGVTTVSYVRRLFPETWIWDHVDMTGTDGVSIAKSVPDTITTWELYGYAINKEDGIQFGARNGALAEVTVFQSFFVSLRLPFSIVRGEVTHVPVAVYNYANTSIEGVQVSIDVSSEHFTIVGGETVISTSIGAQSSSSVTFVLEAIALGNLPIRINAVTPTSVGLSDAVARHLLVKPEGFEQEHVLNSVIELSEGVEQTIKLDATLPDDIVDGASRGYLRVVGDLMSQSIEGLEQLVQQPYGCGEQNMITTAPNLYVAQYLWATGKLTPELKKRTVTYMIQGYGRELKYMLGDGGFSAFENDQVSSTWLTAFVLKVFSQAAASPQNFIVVDEDLLAQSVDFLLGRRLASGEYEEDGVVIHTEMIGGVQSEVALTAYVVTALLAARESIPSMASRIDGSSVSASLDFIFREGVGDGSASEYATILSASTLLTACAIDSSLCASGALSGAMAALERLKIDDGDGIFHFGSVSNSVSARSGGVVGQLIDVRHCTECGLGQSFSVELTAYAVLAYVSQGLLGEAAGAVKWLLQQRNSQGGYRSTQDTVVALEALAQFSAATAQSPPTARVSVKSSDPSTPISDIIVDEDTYQVLQQRTVPVGGEVELVASGAGLILTQLVVKYNTVISSVPPTYELEVTYSAIEDTSLTLVQACITSKLVSEASRALGMVLVKISLPSGFSPHPDSLNRLRAAYPILLKRVEVDTDSNVCIYFQEITEDVCLNFQASQSFMVKALRPATSSVEAYYKPSNRGVAVVNATFDAVAIDNIPESPLTIGGKAVGGPSVPSANPAPAESTASSAGSRDNLARTATALIVIIGTIVSN